MDNNLPKWILASVGKHFDQHVKIVGLHMFVEGQTRDTKMEEFIELRLDGPDEIKSSGSASYEFAINIMVQVAMVQNFHRSMEIAGFIGNKFDNSLPIYSGASLLTCATLIADHKGRNVRVYQLGQLNTHILIQRAAVAGRYRFVL
jgi:hypothetical protein